MPRWGFYLVTLILCVVDLAIMYRDIRRGSRDSFLWYIALWLINVVCLSVAIVARAAFNGFADPPVAQDIAWIPWWISICFLHGGLAIFGILWNVRK